MASLNRVFLIGNLTKDPDVRHTPKGMAVGDLGLAINSTYRTADGAEKEEVVYIDVVVWGRQAETCKEYLSKGSPIFVEGRLQLDQWESNGEKKSRIRVRAERVQFLGRPGGGSGGGGRSSGYDRESARSSTLPPSREADETAPPEDDVPF
ncbi:MAG: single-stranded DNA-binding protein [Candidatus Methylacidiphilales bacterium]